jgi:hypothetical protein
VASGLHGDGFRGAKACSSAYAGAVVALPGRSGEAEMHPRDSAVHDPQTHEGESLSTKDTNPKDAIGADKVPYDLIPESAMAELALAFLEGALKYGRYNWRIAGVRASIYYAAMRRHMAKWWNGECVDPETGVHHLASVMACCSIILDADICMKLTDDRPPKAPVAELVDDLMREVKVLKELMHDPEVYQYTIQDSYISTGGDGHEAGVQAKQRGVWRHACAGGKDCGQDG